MAADAKVVGEQLKGKLGSNGDQVLDGFLTVNNMAAIGSIHLPNSPQTPETSQSVTTKLISVETANKINTGLTIVDGSNATVTKIAGETAFSIKYPFLRDVNGDGSVEDFHGDGSFLISQENGITNIINGHCAEETSYWAFSSSCNLTFLKGDYRICGKIENAPDGMSILIGGVNGDYGTLTWDTLGNINPLDIYIEEYSLTANINAPANITFSNTKLTIYMLKKDAVLDVYPDFNGPYKNAQISGIKSTGRNLFGVSAEYIKSCPTLGTAYQIMLNLKPNTSYCLSSNVPNTNSADGAWIYLNGSSSGTHGVYIDHPRTTTTDENGMLYILIRKTKVDEILSNYWIMLNEGTTATPYTPYTESTMALPRTIELGKYDYIENGKLYKQTGTQVFTGDEGWQTAELYAPGDPDMIWLVPMLGIPYGPDLGMDGDNEIRCISNSYDRVDYYQDISTFTEGIAFDGSWIRVYDTNYIYGSSDDIQHWKQRLRDLYNQGRPLMIVYKTTTPEIINVSFDNHYEVFDGGLEIIEGPKDENGYTSCDYGAIPSFSRYYSIHENPTEAANKAYVNNGLAKKRDKNAAVIMEPGDPIELKDTNGNRVVFTKIETQGDTGIVNTISVPQRSGTLALREDSPKVYKHLLEFWRDYLPSGEPEFTNFVVTVYSTKNTAYTLDDFKDDATLTRKLLSGCIMCSTLSTGGVYYIQNAYWEGADQALIVEHFKCSEEREPQYIYLHRLQNDTFFEI